MCSNHPDRVAIFTGEKISLCAECVRGGAKRVKGRGPGGKPKEQSAPRSRETR